MKKIFNKYNLSNTTVSINIQIKLMKLVCINVVYKVREKVNYSMRNIIYRNVYNNSMFEIWKKLYKSMEE